MHTLFHEKQELVRQCPGARFPFSAGSACPEPAIPPSFQDVMTSPAQARQTSFMFPFPGESTTSLTACRESFVNPGTTNKNTP